MIVADASVVVDYLLAGSSPAGDSLAERFRAHEPIVAPHLLDAEVAQVLRRYTLAGVLTPGQAVVLVDELAELPIRRYPHVAILGRAFDLRDDVTVYDGLYLALAEVLEAPLLTADGALKSVPGCTAIVELLPTA